MAAFSYQLQHPFVLDSFLLPNTKVSGFMDQEGNMNTNCFSQCYPPESIQETTHVDTRFHESILDHSSKVVLSDNEPSVTKKQGTDSSTVVDKLESGEQVTQNVNPINKKRKISRNGSTLSSAQSKDAREGKRKKQKKCNGEQEGKEPKAAKKNQKKVHDQEPPTGYIHVRARRGQATDSHSLAERVRREKISERMKILQRLVPGCDKVTGKALMLDEIINYVQSLQNQVEFLSTKLASVNPLFYDFGMDLDAFMVRPERLNGMEITTLPPLQQCSPTQQPTAFADTITATTFAPANNYPLLDGLASIFLEQEHRPNSFYQDNGSLLWEVDEQRQKFLNQSGFSNNLCSFN